MKIQRTYLKCKSKFYYYSLLFIGSVSILISSNCSNTPSKDKTKLKADSLAKAKARSDSITKADSIAKALLEKARIDSIARADSIAKTKKKQNPYKPTRPVTKYGIPIPIEPLPEYGPPPSLSK